MKGTQVNILHYWVVLMPADYRFDFPNNLVVSIGWGVLTGPEMLDHQRRLKADLLFKPTFNQLLDFGAVSELKLDGDAVRQLSYTTLFGQGARRAILVDERDLFYGFGRMFELLRARGPEEIQVFRRYEEARDWLGLTPNYPRPIPL